ncbi:hydrocephalus-inducing protein homolog [Diachasma alloeum]|uniref:hydrocephalus-inducing protein homolog n=1 Tax=Diachasma alloeum TaxID=454923 RepID=UPI0010FADF62|nr:hydrocephalus-inducing protein homolog [Diachasma alloeum]
MEPGQFREKEFHRKLDVMSILSHFIEPGEEQYGQGDEGRDSAVSFTPSQYKTQLLMSTEDRLEILATAKTQFLYPSELKVTPSIVIFQQFLAKKKYNTTITIINTDTESHFVKVVPGYSPVFSIEFKGSIFNTKVAPGMSHIYNVKFSPDDTKDYDYQLNISTDLGFFSVPIIALGPKPILNFPDIITLPPTAVKIPSAIPLTVQNLGSAPAVFKLLSLSPQFSIKPSNGILNPHKNLQFTLNFMAPSLGNFTGLFFLKYETGELIRIRTQGSTTNCRISLTTENLAMEDTFLGLSTDKTIKIFNDSDYTLDYQWMRFQNLLEDNEEKEKFSEIFATATDTETLRYTNLEYFDICNSEIHEKTCERILQDEITCLTTEDFLFSSKNFVLCPTSGKIWPRSSTQVLVTFQPQVMGEIAITAFLEISGSEQRLPLNISGICRGPEIKLNTSAIEIEKIYLCSTQNIEIISSNVGFIPGTLVHREKPSDFSAVIRVSPQSHELYPNEYKSFNLSFTPSRTGEFVERVDFIIEESSEVMSVYVTGHSICPKLYFDKPSIDLGVTGVSFTSTEEVTLQNRTTVPVKYRLLIPDDVEKPPMIFNAFRLSNASTNESTSSSISREFSISPNQRLLEPQSSAKIMVEFTPTVARGRRRNNLTIEVEGSDGVQQVLPIFYQSKVPVFEIEPSGVNLRSCFINFPYTISFSIKNESDVDGFCYFPRQSCSERSGIFYSLSRSQWHLKPKESKKASITLIIRSIGQQPMELCLLTRGGKSQKYFPIICEGQGPRISVQPTHLDFGDVKVLETTSKNLKIINDSPIPADVKVFLKDKTSPWTVSSPSTEVSALKSMDIDVELMLRDPGTHSDKLILQILHRPSISVELSAVGTGSSVIFDPVIFPEFSFGVLLTHQDNIRKIIIKNEGTKIQKLSFSNNLEVKNVKSPPTSSTFFIEPFTFELGPDAAREIKVLAQSEAPGDVLEHWWIHAMAEGQQRREILGESVFSATFVVPAIKVNKKLLNFFVNVGADEESCSEELTKEFEISNSSGLMLHVKILTSGRFRIVGEEESTVQMMNIVIYDDDTRLVKVFFVPEEEENDFLSKVYDGRVRIEYDGSFNGINIRCKASVNYPNVTLTSKELEFDAIFGNNCERRLIMRNEGPVPVHFNLSWDKNSVKKHLIESRTPSDECEINSEEDFEENNADADEECGKHGEFIKESINDLFTLVKTKGMIPPNSEEIIVLNFSARRPMNLKAQLLCEVLSGRNEVIKINARTDFVRYHLTPKMIDFGFQNILTEVDEVLFLDNSCEMNLSFKVDRREDFENAKGILEIIPSEGIITRKSKIEFKVLYQCLISGNFEEIFTIRIENSSINNITVRGCAILPQIYLDLFHNWAEKNYPSAKEYCALQSLDDFTQIGEDFSVELIRSHHRLTEDNWTIIYPNECFQTRLDIDMRIEQFLATEFIKANRSFLLSTLKVHKPGPIPYLYSAEYILDMNCLIAGQLIHQSLIIYNYSPQKISIRMKPPEKKNYLSRYGIIVKFRDQVTLMPREFCKLDISINPPCDIFAENTQKIKRKVYLEVTNGCTVPISIIGTVTFPLLKLNTPVLNFGDVIIGNCKVMTFAIQNSGIVDCKWRIIMYSEAKPTDFPFSLSDATGTYSPGESGVISGYFKPRRRGSYEVEVVFEVVEGRKESLKLMGRGIDQKLRISEGSIIFAPGVPGATSEKKEFSVKNLSKSPLEFAWQHLDKVGVVEERVMRVLMHYYGSKEILLPVRQLGSALPKKIYEFYEELVTEMKSHFCNDVGDELQGSAVGNENIGSSTEKGNSALINEEEGTESLQVDEKQKNQKDSGSGLFKEKNSVPAQRISKNGSINGEMKQLSEIEKTPEEIGDLLHNYIDRLHEDLEFAKKMKDPVSAIFAELNSPTENSELDEKVNIPKDKSFIIFYGAPFTKYQETACKTAKLLDIPLLNLDSEITRAIATGESSTSSKVRRIIDEKYEELLMKAQKFIQDDDLTSRRDNSERALDREETEDYLKGNVDYTFVNPPDPLISFRKIPDSEELEILDVLSQYEYKIDAINSLQKILEKSEGVAKGKLKVKGAEKNLKSIKTTQKETLVSIEVDSFTEILKEILMKEEFKDGFVLQTLNNAFIDDHSTTFSKIIESIPPESLTFINFHNSVETYQQKVTEKRDQLAKEENDKLLLQLKVMDEMSLSEFEGLSEDDKNLFFEKVQRPRIEEARERREKFKKKISKSKSEEESPKSPNFFPEDTQSLSSPAPAPADKPKKSWKKKGQAPAKDRKSSGDAKSDKKQGKIENGERSSRKEKQVEKTSHDQMVAEAMELYNRNVDTIKSMIDDKSNTWLAAFPDPWDPTNYDFIIDQICQNVPKKETKSTEIQNFVPQIEEKMYSLYSYNRNKRFFSTLPDEVPFQIENIHESDEGTVDSRTILDPGEAKRFKVVFNPQETGELHQDFLLNIIGNNNQVHRISLSGIADIPRLNMDPKSIFTRIKETKVDEIHDPTFFVDTKTFDFGFLLTPENDKKEARVHHKISKLNFANCSLINVDVQFSLLNGHSKAFSLNKSSASVPPGEKEVLTIMATAPQLGPNTDKLLVKILNNPQVEEIILKSSGCQLDIEIDGKILNFGRILLYRKDCRRVILKNKTPIRVFWRIMESNDESEINSQISFSSSSGVIEPLNETHFDIYFHGQLVGIIDKESIRLGIFLFENDEESLLTENIKISAEVYDVSVDVNGANPIDLKTLKIGEKASEVFSLKNRGQYDINFVIELERLKKLSGLDKKLFRNFNEHLKINPLAGTLVRDKLTSINLEFTPKMEIKLKNFPIMKCNLFDISKDAALIAEIPLTISITAQYSKFTIEPYPELFCGSIPIYTHKTTFFSIRNTGIFPVEYTIASKSFQTTEAAEITEIFPPKLPKNIAKKKRKRSIVDIPSKNSKKSPIPSTSENNPLNIGPFTLIKQEGTIAVGKMTEITIDCYPEVEGKLSNDVYIKCSNSPPENQSGRPLILNLDSCIPTINFDDFTSIFYQSHIAETIDNFSCTFDDSHSIFSKEDRTLYFEKVIVSNIHEVGLKLYNPGLVPAEVKMTLQSKGINEKADVFDIEPRREMIPPMSSRIFTVSFTPACMENYSCILEATVVLPDHLESQKLSVKLSGEGCIPEITFIEPSHLCKYGNASLDFGKSLLGETQTETIVLKNTGKVNAKIIAEIADDIRSLYYLKIGDAGRDIHGVHDLRNNFVEIICNCGDTSKISVVFEAREIGIFEALVRIFVSDNPYEITNIDLKAEGFIESVVIKGLALTEGFRDNRIVEEDKFVVSSEEKGKYKKKKGGITKKRKKSSPMAEAIVEDASRSVTLAYELRVGICCVEEERVLEFDILLEISEEFLVSWDDQQTTVAVEEVIESNSEEGSCEGDNYVVLREINYRTEEPHYELIRKDSEIIQLVVSAVAAWTTYYCPVEEINFEDTFVLEKRNFTFELTNPGIINVIYSWKIIDDNHHSMNYFEKQPNDNSQNSLDSIEEFNYENKTQHWRADVSIEYELAIISRCFKILPETGVILPNQATEFHLTFSPEEETQYNASLLCEIAYLEPQIPQLKIPISGKALLPHYHFEIPEFGNDYLNTIKNVENLPENIQIVEFRVIGVGGHHTKQFNLINPTDDSYKFRWKEETLRIIKNAQKFPYFHCESVKGIAAVREKTQMSFSFFAKDVGTFESLWEFCIDEYEITVPFLLVGVVSEPQITCCPLRVELRPTVAGNSIDFKIIIVIIMAMDFDAFCANFKGDVVQESIILTNYEENSLDFSAVRNSLFSKGGLQRLFVEPMSGSLMPKDEKSLMKIVFFVTAAKTIFQANMWLQDMPKIIKGPIFTILLNASAKSPSVEFSFTQHDFGACYIRDQSQPYEVILGISNNEETPAIVEVQAENLQNFIVNSGPLSQAISTQNPISVPIYFQPVDEQKYEEYLTFIVNSTIDKRITLRGEGIFHKYFPGEKIESA